MATKDTICVYLLGHVRKPGAYYFPRGYTLRQAVEAAGGLTLTADWRTIVRYSGILRHKYIGFPPQIIRFAGDRAKAEQMPLEDGDQVYFENESY